MTLKAIRAGRESAVVATVGGVITTAAEGVESVLNEDLMARSYETQEREVEDRNGERTVGRCRRAAGVRS